MRAAFVWPSKAGSRVPPQVHMALSRADSHRQGGTVHLGSCGHQCPSSQPQGAEDTGALGSQYPIPSPSPSCSIHPSHHNNPTPSRPVLQHSSLLLEAACSYIFCCCSSASQISAELPKNACFGQTPALNKQTRAQKRHWVQGQIVKQRCIPVCSALAWGALQGAEKPGGVLVPNRPPQASPALASPKTPTHGTGGRVHPAHSAPLGGDMARTQHTRTYQLLLSQGELILVQT